MPKKKLYDAENTLDPAANPTVEELLEEGSVNTVPPRSGLFHNKVAGPELNFENAPNESWMKRGDSYIVLGTDRPTGLASGFGAKGAQGANSIDLVVGRMASAGGDKPVAPGTVVNNSFVADSARIYISQLTKLDENFGIEGTPMPSAGSGIGIKADGVRIIGRQGVRIVTGTAKGFQGYGNKGEASSLGESIEAAPPIELNAGNFSGELNVPGGKFLQPTTIKAIQPILLGGNTRDGLRELHGYIEEIQAATYNYAILNTAIVNAIRVALEAIPPAQPAARLIERYVNRMQNKTINPLYHTRVNLMLWEMNYLEPIGSKYICSRNVKTS